jgi:hypothetical protein
MSEVGSPPKVARLSSDGSPPKAGRPAAAAAAAVQGGSPGAQKAAAAAWKRQQDASTHAASVAAEVQADRFAKFTIVADPAPGWRRAVQELAEHAAQVREPRWVAMMTVVHRRLICSPKNHITSSCLSRRKALCTDPLLPHSTHLSGLPFVMLPALAEGELSAIVYSGWFS